MLRAGLMMGIAGCSFTAPLQGDGGIDATSVDASLDGPVDVPPDLPFWTSVVGATATGNDLTSTADQGWGKSGAVSIESFTGNGFVEFTTSETTFGKSLGLSKGNTNQNYKDIEFDIQLINGKVFVIEGSRIRGEFGPYAVGDLFRVEANNDVVTYRHNGTLLFTSAATPAYPLLADAALFQPGATLVNVELTPIP